MGPNPMTGWFLVKGAKLETDLHSGRRPCEHEDSHVQAKESSGEEILLSQLSEAINYANISILNF